MSSGSWSREEAWPSLAVEEWAATRATLHRWMQIVGKTPLALAPMQNHWWQVAFQVGARGLRTVPMPYPGGVLEVELDFVGHQLVARTGAGRIQTLALSPLSVSQFYGRYRALLGSLNVDAKMFPRPVEMLEAIPFAEDHAHASYDRAVAESFWRVIVSAHATLSKFRSRYCGKSSPVHFWWGGMDLAYTRFSGRPAPPHPGGVPNVADAVMREAYCMECMSVGWWPGGGGPVEEPSFYAYAYPEPAGAPQSPIQPAAARYDPAMREWILPYEAVRRSATPEAMLLDFAESAYGVSAHLGGWDRTLLERP